MDLGISAIVAAAVAAIGGIAVTIIQLKAFRNENANDHAIVQKRLDTVIDMVGKQGAKLTSHLDWHVTKEPSGSLPKTKQVATRKKK